MTNLIAREEVSLINVLPPEIDSDVRRLIVQTKLSDEQAAKVLAKFSRGFEPFLRLKDEALSIVVTDASQAESIARAREIDAELMNACREIEAVHKTEKEFWLRGGQMVDGCKRIPTNAIAVVREHLKKQFDYVRRVETERIERIASERRARISAYTGAEEVFPGLGAMSEPEFELILAGAKAEFEAKIEADRLERERLALLQAENERLARERDEADRRAAAERQERERVEAENRRLEGERQAEIDRIAREKADAESRRQAAERSKLLAPDRDKLLALVAELRAVRPPAVSTPEAQMRLDNFSRAFTSAVDNLETAANELESDCPF